AVQAGGVRRADRRQPDRPISRARRGRRSNPGDPWPFGQPNAELVGDQYHTDSPCPFEAIADTPLHLPITNRTPQENKTTSRPVRPAFSARCTSVIWTSLAPAATAPSPAVLGAGSYLGPYEIEGLIGRGGMG